MLPPPINLPKWLADHGHLLQPPINNCCVYDGDVTVMIVGGPNARTDYHINPTPEWFYQFRGAMLLRVDDGAFRDIVIPEGSMFLLPPDTPHSPVRFAGTVGLVVELRRPAAALDRMRWYCARCPAAVVVHEAAFPCTDLGSQIKAAVDDFRADDDKRRCPECGELAAWAPAPGAIRDPNLPGGAASA